MSLDSFTERKNERKEEKREIEKKIKLVHKYCVYYRMTYDGWRCVLQPPDKFVYSIECTKREPNCQIYFYAKLIRE
ncbi:MAG: hypothetical protein QXT13_08540 [Pyrobaculum sp.]